MADECVWQMSVGKSSVTKFVQVTSLHLVCILHVLSGYVLLSQLTSPFLLKKYYVKVNEKQITFSYRYVQISNKNFFDIFLFV